MTARQAMEGIKANQWVAWLVGSIVYTAAALIFLYTTFVTAAYQDKFETAVIKQLDRMEIKLDKALEAK